MPKLYQRRVFSLKTTEGLSPIQEDPFEDETILNDMMGTNTFVETKKKYKWINYEPSILRDTMSHDVLRKISKSLPGYTLNDLWKSTINNMMSLLEHLQEQCGQIGRAPAYHDEGACGRDIGTNRW